MFTPQVTKQVTFPLFQYTRDVPMFLKFLSPIERAKEMKKSVRDAREQAGVAAQEPPMIAYVYNLETETMGQYICCAVACAEITDNYPGNAYVGKCFQITIRKPGESKRYNLVELSEIADVSNSPKPGDHVKGSNSAKAVTTATTAANAKK